jgi:hypothetical protein
MAYNVFKRPMFKRGGSTTGTGIMSHVEPRVKAATGFPNFGLPRQPDQSEIDAFKQAEAQRIQSIRNQPSFFLGPRFTDPNYQSPFKDFFSTNTGFGFMNFGPKTYGTGITANITGTGTGTGSGDTGMAVDTGSFDTEDANIKANQAAIDAVNKAAKDNENKDTGEKDKPTYTASNIEDEVVKESELLRKLLKDENYSKGELALVIAGALKEPGGIAAKLDKARELSLPIARKNREEDKAITLAAYKAAKEKEKYETRYGQDSDTIRFYKERAKSLVGTPGYKDKTADQIYRELMSGSAEARVNILKSPQTAGEIKNVTDRIARLTSESKTAKPKRKEQIVDEISQQKTQLDFLIKMPEFESIYPGVKESLGYKYGGRVMKAIGGDVSEEEDTDMQASDNTVGMAVEKIGEGSGSQTVSEPVQRLSYQELRDRLPQEITDDVVSLLSNSEEALQEFAYIRTQDDVNSFNTKYGVNLVIPPTRG